MECAWQELLSIIPMKWRQQVDTLGKENALELRLRPGKPPRLVRKRDAIQLNGIAKMEDMQYVVNMACRYSPWTAESARWGYITAPGGHRIGLCGRALIKGGEMAGYQIYDSLNIRISRDFHGISKGLDTLPDSVLLIGRPGSGKTTLLRDLCRQLSYRENVCVVDERGELFPSGLERGDQMDVISGCSKAEGIDRLLRTMTPDTIAIDEITAPSDAQALLQAARSGVRLLATAHAADLRDFQTRMVYQKIIANKIFSSIVVIKPDKSFYTERMET